MTNPTSIHKTPSPQWHDLLAGATAGFVARLLTSPLDLLKIRHQLHRTLPIASPNTTAILTSLQHITCTEGPRALFRGNVAAMYLGITYSAIQFSLVPRISNVFPPTLLEPLSTAPFVAFLSGAMAGVCATFLTYPLDLCRTAFAATRRLSVRCSIRSPQSLLEVWQSTLRLQGITGLYVGVSPAIIQIVPYMGLNFALYTTFLGTHEPTMTHAGIAGGFAGLVSKCVVYPLDTIKKRMQAQALFGTRGYTHVVDCGLRVWKEEGWMALYRGVWPTMVKSMLGTGCSFAVYSEVKHALEVVAVE